MNDTIKQYFFVDFIISVNKHLCFKNIGIFRLCFDGLGFIGLKGEYNNEVKTNPKGNGR